MYARKVAASSCLVCEMQKRSAMAGTGGYDSDDEDLDDSTMDDDGSDPFAHFAVFAIDTLTLHDYLYLDMDTQAALGIFEEQKHATMHSHKKKEGLSIFC